MRAGVGPGWSRVVWGDRDRPCPLVTVLLSPLPAAQPPFTMCFRVKFYPTDPAALKEEITR